MIPLKNLISWFNLPYETISVKCIIVKIKQTKQWGSNYFADKEKSLEFVLPLLLAFFGKFLAWLKKNFPKGNKHAIIIQNVVKKK